VSSNPEPSKTKGIRIATRCTSVEQFIQSFHRFADEESFFVSTLNTRPPGLETSFSVQLADGTPVLRGMCTVLQAWTEGNNPFKTPGVRLGIKQLTANSKVVFEQLLIARQAAKPPAVPAAVITPIKPVMPAPVATTVPKATATPPKGTPQKPMSIAIGVPKAVPNVQKIVEEPTKVDPPPQETKVDLLGGERTPGSDLVLPANPLMNLTDESLEGYVDCTLYEETGNFFPVEPDEADVVDEVVPPPVLAPRPAIARALTPIPYAPHEPRPPTVTPLPPAPVVSAVTPLPPAPVMSASAPDTSNDTEQAVIPPPTPAPPMPPTPAPPMPYSSALVDPELIARGSAPVFDAGALDSPSLPPEPMQSSFDAYDLPRTATPPAATSNKLSSWLQGVLAAAKSNKREVWLLGGALGVLVAVVVVLVIVTRSSSSGTAAAAKTPPKPAAKEVAQVTAPVDQKKPAETVKTGDTGDTADTGDNPGDPPAGSGPPRVGSGPCSVVIATTPAGSMVQLDDNTVGPSPLTVGTSCEKHKLGISHVRYQATTKLVTLTEGKPQEVDVTLSRPTHSLTVTSTPSGAQVFIDGRSAGTTPGKLSVMGFTTLTLEFKKLGYQPTSTKLYSKVPQDKVTVRLKKW